MTRDKKGPLTLILENMVRQNEERELDVDRRVKEWVPLYQLYDHFVRVGTKVSYEVPSTGLEYLTGGLGGVK